MAESACHPDRQKSDPVAYDRCLREQVDALQTSPGSPDLSTFSSAERRMMKSACHPDGQLSGPAAYYRCLREQVNALQTSRGSPDLTTISRAERRAIESACHLDRQMSGPAAYYQCLRKQVNALSADHPPPSESQTTSGKTSAQQSRGESRDRIVPPGAGPARRRPAIPHSGAASVSTSGNKPVEASPHPESNSSLRILTAWLVGLFVVGFFAKIFYDQVKARKCGRCGNPTETRGSYCAACVGVMEESQRRAAEQQAAEERARAEAERYERAQWEIEESRRVTVLAELHQLTGPQFDDMIASLFRKDGYTVRRGGGDRDRDRDEDEGINLVLQMGQEKDVVQCKRSQSDIGLPVVREFYGALMHAAARHGFIVTTASFNQSARDFARGKPISLISAAEILRWIDGTYSLRAQGVTRPNTKTETSAFDPYAVLGVSPNASLEEIRAAYRREMVNYHPDKVAHLGKELQELAKTKAQEINRAFEELAHSH
ncbi:MAG TPA: restriction endonuclease [Candidatus Angelobacter sp.]